METYHMRVNYLTKNQIDYELLIRDIKTTKKDLNIKRKMLRKLLDKEEISKREYDYDSFDFDTEKIAIDTSIDEIRLLINDFEGPESDSGHIRIKTYLIHLIHRVNRIRTDNVEPDIVLYISNYKSEAKATCLELEALLFEKTQQSVAAETIQPNLNSTMMHNTNVFPNNIVQNTCKSVPVYKWGLTFSGDKNSSLKSFLERVNELCASRNVSKNELFNSACDLFSDNGLIWFRSVKNTVTDWESLVQLMYKEFLPSDYDDRLWTEIRERTQGKNESITIYVAIMETLFNRLNKGVPEPTRLKYIKKNILPHYISRLALTTINSISELISYCKKIDDADSVKNKYHPPSSHCSLEPELAYNNNYESSPSNHNSHKQIRKGFHDKHKSRSFVNKKKVPNNQNNNISIVKENSPSTSAINKKIVCFNCRLENHYYQDCRAPRKKFCFKCGKQGETIKTCSCSKNE